MRAGAPSDSSGLARRRPERLAAGHRLVCSSAFRRRENLVGVNLVLAEYNQIRIGPSKCMQNTLKTPAQYPQNTINGPDLHFACVLSVFC